MAETSVEEIDYDNPPFPLNSADRQIIATRDEDYHRITWDDLRQIIANNTLEDLKRLPSDLRRYLAWSHTTKQQYGSITNFVMQERLHWTPDPALATPKSPIEFSHHSDVPFEDARDYVVLKNDWPYGFVPGIVHLLVWTRTRIAVDDSRGDVTPESRKLIEEFVEKHFVMTLANSIAGDGDDSGLEEARQRVLWFKNWVSLQSVRGVDHVHVLVKDAPEGLLERWLERSDQ